MTFCVDAQDLSIDIGLDDPGKPGDYAGKPKKTAAEKKADKERRRQEAKEKELDRKSGKKSGKGGRLKKELPSEHEKVFRAPFKGCTKLGRQFIRGIFHE